MDGMDDKIKERIRLVLKEYNTNPTKLSKGDQALQRKFSRQLNDAEVTYSLIAYLLDAFPDVSAEWLIRGNGDMILSDSSVMSESEGGEGYVTRDEFHVIADKLMSLIKLSQAHEKELEIMRDEIDRIKGKTNRVNSA